MTLFFEYHPEFSDAIKEMYLHIERTQLESAYFTGKVQYDSGKSEQQFFAERYED
jgi:hypothetical protein